MGFASLKDYLRTCIASLEQQLLHDTNAAGPPQPLLALEGPVPAAAAAAPQPVAVLAENVAAAGAAAMPDLQDGDEQGDGSNDMQQLPAAAQEHAGNAPGAAAQDAAEPLNQQAAAGAGNRDMLGFGALRAAAAVRLPTAAAPAQGNQIIPLPAPPGPRDIAGLFEPARDDQDAWGDIPFEELIGLQGPWVNFLETIVLVMIGNAFFMAAVINMPLNLGRVMLAVLRHVLHMLSAEQQVMFRAAIAQHAHVPLLSHFARALLHAALPIEPGAAGSPGSVLLGNLIEGAGPMVANTSFSIHATLNSSSLLTNATAVVAATAAGGGDAAPGVAYPLESLPIMALTLQQLLRELQAQVITLTTTAALCPPSDQIYALIINL